MSIKADKQRMSPAQRAQANPSSKSLAIHAFCYQCQGGRPDDADRQIMARVRDCANEPCPLWPHRGWLDMTSYRSAS